ncbi:hypothetical protein ACPA2M_26815, partial [Ectopseudomonas chengduensis]
CVAALRLPVRMIVEQVSGSAWAECPNGVESALKGQLEAEREKNAALVKRMAYFEQDKDNALRLLSSEFANVSKRSGSARLVDVGVGALIALVVSLSTLYPAAEQYLKTPSHNHQQR